MSVVTCDQKTLNAGQKCYSCLSDKEVQAAIVYWLEQRRAVLTGQTPQTVAQLRKSAACFGCMPANLIADGLDAFIAQQGAIVAGAPGASIITIAQIRAAIKGFANTSIQELRSMEIITRCALNAFP
jgi:hypothetical protein